MTDDQSDFEQFMRQRQQASHAYMNGDASLFGEIIAGQPPITFFKPQGGAYQGAEAISSFEQGAAAFERSSDDEFEILHMAASDDLAYWVGLQRSMTYLRGRTEAVQFHVRVTELFRREDGAWKLIHRHADPLVSEPAAKPQ
jgi:ketosteroid isomerase-like protein